MMIIPGMLLLRSWISSVAPRPLCPMSDTACSTAHCRACCMMPLQTAVSLGARERVLWRACGVKCACNVRQWDMTGFWTNPLFLIRGIFLNELIFILHVTTSTIDIFSVQSVQYIMETLSSSRHLFSSFPVFWLNIKHWIIQILRWINTQLTFWSCLSCPRQTAQ